MLYLPADAERRRAAEGSSKLQGRSRDESSLPESAQIESGGIYEWKWAVQMPILQGSLPPFSSTILQRLQGKQDRPVLI